MIYPVELFPINTAVLVKVKTVDCQEHQATLLSGLSRFTNFTQLKLVKTYLSKIATDKEQWYREEPTNPSEKANAWFCDVLSKSEQRIDVSQYKISKDAKTALTKVHNNQHHNFIVKNIINSKRKASIQASFVRITHENLKFSEKQKEVIKQKKLSQLNDENAFITNLAKHDLTRSVIALIDSIEDEDNKLFVTECLKRVPKPLQARIAKRFIDKYEPSLKRFTKKQNETEEAFKERIAQATAEKLKFSEQQKHSNTDIAGSFKDHFNANRWLKRTINTLKPRLKILKQITDSMPLPWHILANVDKTKKHAGVLAREVIQIVNDLRSEKTAYSAIDIFEVVANYAAQFSVKLEFAEKGDYLTQPDAEVGILKAQCHKWWSRKLKPIRSRYLEHLEIATGEVGKDLFTTYDKKKGSRTKRKGITAYCSRRAVSEYKADRERGKRYLESLELVNEQNDVISLMKAVAAGVANPKNMRNELMLRIRETEELADEMGYVGMFLNITAPSPFHANSAKWDGSTPKEASAYLNKIYSQARAKLDRLNIPYFGIRVAEPHADGCPHWHMLLWTPERYYHRVNHVLRRYFTRDDRAVFFDRFKNRKALRAKYVYKRRIWGLNKSKGKFTREPTKDYFPSGPRYTAIRMEPAKVGKDGKKTGGAAAYVAKYVSKNIDGFALANEYDAETGEKLTESINPVKAWASTWGIRQFQFQKSPAITIWRELRRIREEVKGNEELEKVRFAAHKGDFKTFVVLMGGFGIGRDSRFKPAYEFTEYGNQYAECVKRLKGIEDTHGLCTLVTRVHSWEKQPIGTAAANDDTAAETMQEANNVGAADLSWTSGNNCTPCTTRHSDEFLLDMHDFTEQELKEVKKDLLSGKKIKRNDLIYQIRQGQLIVFDHKAQIKERKREYTEHLAHSLAQKQADELKYQAQSTAKADWDVLTPEQEKAMHEHGHVLVGRRVYHMQDGKLTSFKKVSFNDMDSTIKALPTAEHWVKAREVMNLAFSFTELEGRELPSNTEFNEGLELIGDIELATLVIDGKASAINEDDWWSMDMMA